MNADSKNLDFQQPLETDYVEHPELIDPEEFEKVVRSRRSVRIYNDQAIPESIMRRCLDLALLAPNSSNLQAWEFYWVRDAEKKKQLADFCLGQPAATTAQELVICVARLDTWRRNQQKMIELLESGESKTPQGVLDYYRKIVPLAYSHGPAYLFSPFKRMAMHLIALRKPSPRKPSSKSDMRVWAHKTTALACQNLMLALRAHGFDSCPMEGFDEPRIKKLIGLPRGAEVCMVVSAGKRAEHGVYGKQVRFDKSLFVFEV